MTPAPQVDFRWFHRYINAVFLESVEDVCHALFWEAFMTFKSIAL